MACVHEIDRRNAPHRHCFRYSIQDLLDDGAACPECRLLLEVIEEVSPGWLRKSDALLEIEFDYFSIQLFETPIEAPISTSSSSDSWSTQLSDSRSQSPADTCLKRSFSYYRLPNNDPFFAALIQNDLHEHYDYSRKLQESLDIIRNTSSLKAIERMSKWLSYCIDNDIRCRMPDESFTPRRLISTGYYKNDKAFLFEPVKSPDKNYPYVCLSYCWGEDTANVLKTTKNNIASHHDSIDLTRLPQTLQDAIYVCRGIKVPFLWVDSICIIQDDNADWNDQASQMKNIYANSHLTICALEPSSCQDGFLGEQQYGQREWQRMVQLNVPIAAGGPGDAVLIRQDSHCETISSSEKRAWCFQEFTIPTRTLSFNGREMRWDCNCRIIDESGRFSREKHELELRGLQDDYYDIFFDGVEGGPDISARTYAEWEAIVKAFSSRAITNPKDRLPALHGLSKIMAIRLEAAGEHPGNFLAGLWKNNFIRGLTWRVVPSKIQAIGPRFHIAPSWSWVYPELSVEYNFLDTFKNRKYESQYKEDCYIEDVFCRGIFEWGVQDTAPVHNAFVILCGKLQRVKLVHMKGVRVGATDNSSRVESDGDKYRLFMDLPQPVKIKKVNPEHATISGDYGNETSQGLLLHEVFRCFRLFTRSTNIRSKGIYKGRFPTVSTEHAEVWFLILRPLLNSEIVQYERVGVGVYTGMLCGCDLFEGSPEERIMII